jgi:hypothetical protein
MVMEESFGGVEGLLKPGIVPNGIDEEGRSEWPWVTGVGTALWR